MNITAIDHVQLAIPKNSEEMARTFYRSLGFTEIAKPEPLASRGGCWFKSNAAILHLGIEDPFVAARKAHPAFRISDLSSFRKHLQSLQINIIEDTSLSHVRRLFINDPFGNRIEFLQEGDIY
jgi:catechol 2,3-dioxygenase-like lactoylglutathione lyase family enzyme